MGLAAVSIAGSPGAQAGRPGKVIRITGLGPERGAVTGVEDERPISAQVADLISGEAAQAIAVANVLPLRLGYQQAASRSSVGLGEKSDTMTSLRP